VRKQNGWMRRVLERCLRAYAALKEDRWDHLVLGPLPLQ